MLFSEREGYVEKKVQLDSLTPGLRNRLWNVLYESAFKVIHRDVEREQRIVALAIWDQLLKMPVDEFPGLWNGVPVIKNAFLSPKVPWHFVFDVLEFAVGTNLAHSTENQFQARVNAVLAAEASVYRFVSGRIVKLTRDEELAEVACPAWGQSCIPVLRLGTQETTVDSKFPQPDLLRLEEVGRSGWNAGVDGRPVTVKRRPPNRNRRARRSRRRGMQPFT